METDRRLSLPGNTPADIFEKREKIIKILLIPGFPIKQSTFEVGGRSLISKIIAVVVIVVSVYICICIYLERMRSGHNVHGIA